METPNSKESRSARTRTIITATALAAGLLLGWVIDDLAFGLLMGFLISLPITSRFARSHNLMEFPPGTLLRIGGAGAFFFGAIFAANWAMGQELDQTTKVLIGSLTAIPGLLFIYTLGQAISSLDELQRRIQTEAMAIGFGLSALMLIVVGLLADAGVPQLNWLMAAAGMSAFWLLGKLWTTWKYR